MGERYTLKQIQKLQLYFEYIYWHLFKVLRLRDKVVKPVTHFYGLLQVTGCFWLLQGTR